MLKHRLFWGLVVGFLLCGTLAAPLTAAEPDARASSAELLVYVGTYTRGESEGIYLCRLDLATGAIRSLGLAAEADNPSFLAIHPSRPLLYAVGEIASFAGKRTGAVSAFSIHPESGKLVLLNRQPSRGAGPCHLVVDQTGQCVLVANYGGGSVACLPIEDDGRLGEATSFVQHEGSSVNPRRQAGPHAHSINLDRANRFALAADLGLDKILVYRFDAVAGALTANEPAWAGLQPGAGPRHLAFHPNGRFVYVINELASTVTAFRYDSARGVLEPRETLSTLPEGFQGDNTTADVHVHPSGKFLYGSNRGHDSIAIFAIDARSGTLRHVGNEPTQGRTPRNFGIDPTGALLLAANQATDNIVVFRIDPKTGRLRAAGHEVSIPSPVCVKMMRPTEAIEGVRELDSVGNALCGVPMGLAVKRNGTEAAGYSDSPCFEFPDTLR